MIDAAVAVYAVAGLATAGIIFRPLRLPEYVFALAGAAVLVALGLIPWRAALAAALKGEDVYLFLVGMMLLAEVARRNGLFDWTARHAVAFARGSATRLFALVYAVGALVTVFLSNDATAVVLTPAVYAAAKAARAAPLPHLFACAFIANAASFVLPISNPANLVMFGRHMPELARWLALFAAPSLAAILVTFAALRWSQRRALAAPIADHVAETPLSRGGALSALGLGAAALALVAASARGLSLGLPTLACGLGVSALVLVFARQSPMDLLRGVSWGVLPLVAGLFVLVEGLAAVGAVGALAQPLAEHAAHAPRETAAIAGLVAGLLTNIANNLPLGLLSAFAAEAAQTPLVVKAGLLIGIDLGPNLSITGSLATLLWLVAIRREGAHVDPFAFLKVGALVMPPALIAALVVLALV